MANVPNYTVDRTIKGRKVKVTVSTLNNQFAAAADCPDGGRRCAHYGTRYLPSVKGAVNRVTSDLSTHLRRVHD